MKQTGQCPKCHSTKVVSDAQVLEHGHQGINHELRVARDRRPQAILFKGKQQTTVSAWVCTACGFIELYADQPSTLQLPKA